MTTRSRNLRRATRLALVSFIVSCAPVDRPTPTAPPVAPESAPIAGAAARTVPSAPAVDSVPPSHSATVEASAPPAKPAAGASVTPPKPSPGPGDQAGRRSNASKDNGMWCGYDTETAKLPRCNCFGAHPNSTCNDP